MKNKGYWNSPFGEIEKSTESILFGLKFIAGAMLAMAAAYVWVGFVALL
jgi:hypothetical protein